MKLLTKILIVLEAVQQIEASLSEDDAILLALASLEKLEYPHVMIAFLREVNGKHRVVAEQEYAIGKKWREAARYTNRDYEEAIDMLPRTLKAGTSCFILNSGDPRTKSEFGNDDSLCRHLGIITQYVIPLMTPSRKIGTLQVDMGNRRGRPTNEITMLDALAAHLSMAIDRFRTHTEVEELNALLIENSKIQAFDAAAAKIMHELMHSIGDYNQQLNSALRNPQIRQNGEALRFLELTKRRVDNWIASVSANVASVRKNEESGNYRAAEIIQEAVEIWYRKAKVRKCNVEAIYSAHDVLVNVRRGSLLEVLAILIINALDANARQITIRLEATEPGLGRQKEVIVRVIDNGHGIPFEFKSRLREFGWTSKGVHGHGLGLTVVRLLAKQMGGDAKFAMYGKAGGEESTEFLLRIPHA